MINSYSVKSLHVYTNMSNDFLNLFYDKVAHSNYDIVFYQDKALFEKLKKKKVYLIFKPLKFDDMKKKNALKNGVVHVQVDIQYDGKRVYSNKFKYVKKNYVVSQVLNFLGEKLLKSSKNNSTHVEKLIISFANKKNKSNISIKDFLSKKETIISNVQHLNYLHSAKDHLFYIENNKFKHYPLNEGKKNKVLSNIAEQYANYLFFQPKMINNSILLTSLLNKKNFTSSIVKINIKNGDMQTLACGKSIFLNPILSKNIVFFQMLDNGCMNLYKMDLSKDKVEKVSRGAMANCLNMAISPDQTKIAFIQQMKDSPYRVMSILDIASGKISNLFKSMSLSCDLKFFTNEDIAFHDKSKKSILAYNYIKQNVKKIFLANDIQSFCIQ